MRKRFIPVGLSIVFLSVMRLQAQPCSATWGSDSSSLIWTTCAKVGIGTSAPQRTLDIYTAGGDEAVRIQNSVQISYAQLAFKGNGRQWQLGVGNTDETALGVANKFFIYDAAAGAARFAIDTSGKVGIRTANPQRTLDIYSADGNEALRIQNTLDFSYAQMAFKGTGRQWQMGVGNALETTLGVANKFFIYDADSNAPVADRVRLSIDTSGNVQVKGSLTATSVIGATYQDMAEWVPAGEVMASGTVVVVDGDARNTVVPSDHPYDTRVAGVVSAMPGVLLGVEGPSKAKIATTGRVKVRVDATKHSIAAGDLLVTSTKPGMAMRSEPVDVGGVKMHRPGTLIGKALEPLDRGKGEILVLLSLQ